MLELFLVKCRERNNAIFATRKEAEKFRDLMDLHDERFHEGYFIEEFKLSNIKDEKKKLEGEKVKLLKQEIIDMLHKNVHNMKDLESIKSKLKNDEVEDGAKSETDSDEEEDGAKSETDSDEEEYFTWDTYNGRYMGSSS
tara:strand:+ start:382 stop:801 length:420 start_codon:yes stop_codon:yes gene_type:complete